MCASINLRNIYIIIHSARIKIKNIFQTNEFFYQMNFFIKIFLVCAKRKNARQNRRAFGVFQGVFVLRKQPFVFKTRFCFFYRTFYNHSMQTSPILSASFRLRKNKAKFHRFLRLLRFQPPICTDKVAFCTFQPFFRL